MSSTAPSRPGRVVVSALVAALGAGFVSLSAGCTHPGPRSIAMDRFDYNSAIAESWKEQTLLNIVKLRYMDLPVFVDVSSIVAGYTMETSLGAGGEFYPTAGNSGYASLGGKATFTDRPTVTYTPLTGEKFLSGVMKPLDPAKVFSLLQAGYAADFVLGLTVESLNGLHNRSEAGGVIREAQPEFLRAIQLIREVQLEGGVGLRVVPRHDASGGESTAIFFRRENVTPEVVAKTAEIRRLLQLPADVQEFTLIFSPVRGGRTDLAVNSRSMLQIMGAFASYVDAPEEHLARHMTAPMFEGAAESEKARAPVRIHSGRKRPPVTYASVQYRDYWFWIDDGDWQSKRALTAIMFFFTLEDGGAGGHQPVVTIPAG